MSDRRLKLMEIREIIRHIREERSDRQIGKDLGLDWRTVKPSRQWAQEQGLLDVDLPDHHSLLESRAIVCLDRQLPPVGRATGAFAAYLQSLLFDRLDLMIGQPYFGMTSIKCILHSAD